MSTDKTKREKEMADDTNNTANVNQETPAPEAEVPNPTPAPKEEVPKEDKVDEPKPIELKLPKDSLLDDKAVDRIKSLAKENNLSQEQAQLLLENESNALSTYDSAQKEKLTTLSNQWIDQSKADPEIGGKNFDESISLAQSAMKKFATEAFIQNLNKTQLGNHPEMIRVFARIGRAMQSDKLVIGSNEPTDRKGISDLLYGASNN